MALPISDFRERRADLTEERFLDLAWGLRAIVWESDERIERISYVCDAAEPLLEYPVSAWLTEPGFLERCVHPDEGVCLERLRREIAAGRDHTTELRMVTRSGLVLWVRCAVRVLRDPENRVRGVRGVLWDITSHKRAEDALRDNRQRQRYLLDHAGDIIYKTDLQGRITYFNPAAPRLLQLGPNELLGLSYLDVIRPDYREAVRRFYLRQYAAGQASSYFELPVLTGHGDYLWLGQNVQLVIEGERVVGFQAIARDLTQHKLAEARLRDSEERYRVVAEAATDAIITVDRDFQIVFVNPSAQTVFGYTAREMLGRPLTLVLPQFAGYFHLHSASLDLGTGRGYFQAETLEITGRHKSSRAIPLEMSLGEFTEGGRHFYTAVIRDITERQRAQEELQEANETLRALIDASPLAIMAIDGRGYVTKWNAAAVATFGYSEQEVVGRCLFDDPESSGDALLQALDSGKTVSQEGWRVTKAGESLLASTVAASMRDAEGRICGAVGLIADITERRRLEDQLRQAQKMEAVGQLAGGVAHDFNNLLTVITGYNQLLLNVLPSGERPRTYAQEVTRAAERASSLTRQLLAFSRRQIVQPRPIDLNEVVTNMTKMLRRLIGENIDFVTHLRADTGTIVADPGQLEQILINLVVNARDAMPEGGKLTIETAAVELDDLYVRSHMSARPGPHVLLAVSDTGHGMDAETKRRIFEPFFTTKELGKGTGLGLSTVYGIVKQNNANIWVYSEPERGTTFKLYFPAIHAAAEPTAPRVRPALNEGSETVLVVEDEAGLRSLVQELLEQLGYRVLTADSGQRALEISLQETPIDLLLTDVVMPDVNGRETAEKLCRIRPHMRVLYMSGYPDETIVRHGVLPPDVAFLQKPFTQEVLGAKVREVLDRTGQPAPAAR